MAAASTESSFGEVVVGKSSVAGMESLSSFLSFGPSLRTIAAFSEAFAGLERASGRSGLGLRGRHREESVLVQGGPTGRGELPLVDQADTRTGGSLAAGHRRRAPLHLRLVWRPFHHSIRTRRHSPRGKCCCREHHFHCRYRLKGNSCTPPHRSRPTRRKKNHRCHCCRRCHGWSAEGQHALRGVGGSGFDGDGDGRE